MGGRHTIQFFPTYGNDLYTLKDQLDVDGLEPGMPQDHLSSDCFWASNHSEIPL